MYSKMGGGGGGVVGDYTGCVLLIFVMMVPSKKVKVKGRGQVW